MGRSRRHAARGGALLIIGIMWSALGAACGPTAAPAPAQPAGGAAAPPAAGGSVASAPSTAPTAPAAPVKLNASFSELVTTDLPIWIAKETGLFEQRGLDVTLVLMESTTGLPALIAGEVQVAQLGGGAVVGAGVSGADVVILANLAPVSPYYFMVAPSIKSPDDLRGQRVGISRIGSSSDIATRLALRKLGLEPERDVSLVQVGSAQARTAAALSGAIQGAVAQPPENLTLDAAGFVPLLDLASQGIPASTLVISTRRPWADANRDTMQRYVDAIVAGIARQRQDRAFAVGVLKQYLRSDDDQSLGVAYDFYTQKVVPALPYARPEQFADALDQLAESNDAARGFDVSKLLDDSFVQSAAARGLAAR